MPASLILPLFFTGAEIAAGGLAVIASRFAINLVASMAVSSLINKNSDQTQGAGRTGGVIQLPPATDNKLPIVYGQSWTSPIIVDVKMSTDQQTMWYVLAFSETTDSGTVSFDQVYWDDKILIFDPANPNEIRGWYNPQDNTTVTGVAGKIAMWFYRDGSLVTGTEHHCIDENGTGFTKTTDVTAIDVLKDAGIDPAQQWTDDNLMTKTVFAVVRINYDSDHGVTGLGEIKALVNNTLSAPGDVMRDYLQNARYGCGVDATAINTDQFDDLNTYSSETHQLINTDGGYHSGTRYKINGQVDTNQNCLNNLVLLADSADSWVQWNEEVGKWGVLMNRSLEESGLTTATMRTVTSDNILGGISIDPLDLHSTYNSINVQFPNILLRDQTDYRYYELDNTQRFANEPNNELSLSLPFCNNSLQATYIGYKRLFSSRSDLNISFTMDYSGIQIDAGDIIAVNHEWYGWSTKNYGLGTYPGKPFRVTQVRESKDENGFLTAQISAMSYNDQVYTTTNPHYFSSESFSGITDVNYISKPDRPIIPYTLIDSTSGSYVVQGNIPVQGNVRALEFWYSVKGAELIPSNNYVLYNTQYYNGGSLYPHTDDANNIFYEQTRVYLPSGNYWWRTRAEGTNSVSEFSDASTGTTWDAPGTPPPGFNSTSSFTWSTTGTAVTGTQILDGTISGSKVTTGDPQKTGGSNSGGFFDTLGTTALVGLGAAAAYAGYKKGYFDDFLPDFLKTPAGGNDAPPNDDVFDPNVAMNDPNTGEPYGDDNQPQPGDEFVVVADVTPDPGSIASDEYINFDGYDTEPFYASNDNTGGDFSFDDFGDLFG
jgi:hypothetical protein